MSSSSSFNSHTTGAAAAAKTPAFAIAAFPGRTTTTATTTTTTARPSLFHGRALLSRPLSSSSSPSRPVRVTPHADIDPVPTTQSKPGTTEIPPLNGHLPSTSTSSNTPTTATKKQTQKLQQSQQPKPHYRGPTATPLLDSVADDPSALRKLSPSQLPQLAHELRWDVLHHVSQVGGHLGSSLGVIELTIALHYVFNTPHDRLIWDVSHQAYPHKILTGRRAGMATIRQHGGLSGFTKRAESVYDPFGAGHSSTSISAGLGMQVARDMAGIPGLSIAVIGDGAITGGQAYEAMNNAGYLKNRFVVIFNDNDQVSLPTGTKTVAGVRPSGALSDYTTRMMSSRAYHDVRELAKSFSKLFPEGVQDVAAQVDEMTRTMFTGATPHHQNLSGGQVADGEFPGSTGETHAPAGTLFEQLGFHYFGIVDGHNLASLVPVLNNVRDLPDNKPILVHVRTEKGKGYAPAEGALDKYHGVASFELGTGKQHKPASPTPAYTSVFASALIAQAERDDKVVALTAAMPGGTGLNTFGEKFPDKCHDVGIAEQHAVTMAAGMACEGYKPFCCIYSTFLQRGYDQLVHDVAIQNLPVRFVLDRAGLVGNDGPTHHGSFDLAYIGCVPNMMIMAPSDEVELVHMVATAAKYDSGPSVLRYPRGRGVGLDVIRNEFGVKIDEMPKRGMALPIGKGRIIRRCSTTISRSNKKQQKVAILSIGTRLQEACKAASTLEETHGVPTTVADARFMKPLDRDLVRQLAAEHDVLVTVEEGSIGGFGDHVLHFMALDGLLDDGNVRIRPMVLPDRYIEHGSQKQQYEEAGLTARDIEMTVLKLTGDGQSAMEIAVANATQNGNGKE